MNNLLCEQDGCCKCDPEFAIAYLQEFAVNPDTREPMILGYKRACMHCIIHARKLAMIAVSKEESISGVIVDALEKLTCLVGQRRRAKD